MMAVPSFDPANAEIVEFQQTAPNWKSRLKLGDGTVLEVEVSIAQVLRVGHAPDTGFPVYNVQPSMVVRAISIDQKSRKKPLRPAVAADARGFA
jgi:hypothetical protein